MMNALAVVADWKPRQSANQNSRAVQPRLDRGFVEHRLITMRRAVGQLVGVGSLDRERLEIDPAIGLVLERILALLVELAVAINNHVLESVLGEVPQKSADSFGAAEKAGMIDAELATALVPPEGPHNVLLQLYMDTEPEEVAAVVSAATSGYEEYVQQVTRWIEANASA
ncbi:UNVERIFIED_ORG: uncharacterized protein YutE (UPF0331/DUF86 family) [Nocardia globerula]|uniref:Uncharacterized protein YutE (UPF0331/DUF86 family) n=2 Tax=Nocardiaceae TaxID=85025 RepID=A0A652YH12_NOCGL|nr:uncharacterized protein YutE (UPF0331/DUF86 family) [Rhodococcus globerulus]